MPFSRLCQVDENRNSTITVYRTESYDEKLINIKAQSHTHTHTYEGEFFEKKKYELFKSFFSINTNSTLFGIGS